MARGTAATDDEWAGPMKGEIMILDEEKEQQRKDAEEYCREHSGMFTEFQKAREEAIAEATAKEKKRYFGIELSEIEDPDSRIRQIIREEVAKGIAEIEERRLKGESKCQLEQNFE